MKEFNAYVGLDDHKDFIEVSVAYPGDDVARHYGKIPNTPAAVAKLVKRLSPKGERLSFAYEAGPCGYGLYRQIGELGHHCQVVAPSLTPRKAGDRVKTDRRDSLSLATLRRAGALTPVWVPGPEQEAMRDLSRAREDAKAAEKSARQQLAAFLLRNGRRYQGKSSWTQAHWRWIERLQFDQPQQYIVLQDYIDTIKRAQHRTQGLEQQMREALPQWSLAPVVEALMALRSISLVSAMTIVAEIGDISRFDNPRQLMGFLGLVPSEHSSGKRRIQGAITKSGNGHVRRILVEAGWNYRFPARMSREIRQRAEKTSPQVQAIAWQGQKRLCARYRYLAAKGKCMQQVTTAVARELVGFIWAIACEVMGKPHASRALA